METSYRDSKELGHNHPGSCLTGRPAWVWVTHLTSVLQVFLEIKDFPKVCDNSNGQIFKFTWVLEGQLPRWDDRNQALLCLTWLYHYHFGLLSCHATCYKLHWVSLKFFSPLVLFCDCLQIVNGVLGFVEIEVTRVIRLLAAKLSIKDDLHVIGPLSLML